MLWDKDNFIITIKSKLEYNIHWPEKYNIHFILA
jgi:hypothetical protein